MNWSKCRGKKLAQGFNTAARIRSRVLVVESPKLYPWATALYKAYHLLTFQPLGQNKSLTLFISSTEIINLNEFNIVLSLLAFVSLLYFTPFHLMYSPTSLMPSNLWILHINKSISWGGTMVTPVALVPPTSDGYFALWSCNQSKTTSTGLKLDSFSICKPSVLSELLRVVLVSPNNLFNFAFLNLIVNCLIYYMLVIPLGLAYWWAH